MDGRHVRSVARTDGAPTTSQMVTVLGLGSAMAAAVSLSPAGAAAGAALLKLGMVPAIPFPMPDPGNINVGSRSAIVPVAPLPGNVPQLSLLELLFPNFDTNTFVFKISMLQIA